MVSLPRIESSRHGEADAQSGQDHRKRGRQHHITNICRLERAHRAGFGYVDRIFITAARSMGASNLQNVPLCDAAGRAAGDPDRMRIGFTVALLSILGSETIASLEGLGHQIVHLAEAMETARMFAYITFAVVIAACLNTAVSSLERRSKRR